MKVDIEALRAFEKDGYLKSEKHPKMDLIVWDYTSKTQYDQMWLPETLICRGLITNSEGVIVERPFSKFFNFEEHIDKMGGMIPEYEPIVTEKIDGQLGIMYFNEHEGRFCIATRDSFVSDAAEIGTEILNNYVWNDIDKSFTYLFEIIAPELKNIVDYGKERQLLFIAAVNRETGFGVPLEKALPMPVPKRKIYDSMEDMFSETETANREGYVLYYPTENLRLKFKFDEFVKMNRKKSGVTEEKIWKTLKEGKTIESLVENVPDEFFGWVHEIASEFRNTFNIWKQEAENVLRSEDFTNLKPEEAEEYIRKNHEEDQEILIAILHDIDCDDLIWDQIKPITK